MQNPSVQKDLELVADQTKKIEEIQRAFNDKIKDQLKDLKLGNKDGARNLSQVISELRASQSEEINSLLLDHQRTRLQQIALQQHMKTAGTAGALSSKRWAEALGIDDEQQKRLQEKAKELGEERKEKIAKMDADIKARLLKELTPEQRKKLEEMTGDEYQSKTEDWREKFDRRDSRQMQRLNRDN